MNTAVQAVCDVIDYAEIKKKQQATWASGDFAVIGSTLQIVGELLCEAVDLRAGENVLDVAAGNGNASLAAARRFAHVTSTDYVPELLRKGMARAQADGFAIAFQEADAEHLPFENESFGVVLSTFGAMFTPQHARVANEMMRVLKPGGRIGLANWTPDGFIGQLFKTIAAHIPPQAGLRSPALWGTQDHLVNLFSDNAERIHVEKKNFNFRYESAEHWLQVFRYYYGPTHRAFAALAAEQQLLLAQDILALLNQFNCAGPDSLVVPAQYLEVVITKRKR